MTTSGLYPSFLGSSIAARFLSTAPPPAPPSRPAPWVEWTARHLLLALAPPIDATAASAATRVPKGLGSYESLRIPRREQPGTLDARFFPADGADELDEAKAARGAVLLCHPWHPLGQAYFYRRARIPALRRAGYHVMTFDFGGFGASGPMPDGFSDCDVDDALTGLRTRAGDLPVHVWGVSAGGYWAHLALIRRRIDGAFFEHVTDHLIEWSKRTEPRWMPFYRFFQHALSPAYEFLRLEGHARHLLASSVSYVGGELDLGAPAASTRTLARLARGDCLVVPDADHLEAIRRDPQAVLDLALLTFQRAESRRERMRRAS